MTGNLKDYLSNYLNDTITKVTPVSGGDISTAYCITTKNNLYFLKTNGAPNAMAMFQKETHGLKYIAKTNTIKTPQVIACDNFEKEAFLLMEFIESKQAIREDYNALGEQLAQLHKCSAEHFGLIGNNFIGSLPQSNTTHASWVDFYTHERLVPQLQLAKQKGLIQDSECPPTAQIKEKLNPYFANIKPSLLHGDLWGGNYLISKAGDPYLIDPAVYFGHHEVDIAMTKLFGGFNTTFYESYHTYFPLEDNTSHRIKIYQLYYLLVHLNMFGSSYYSSVASILKKFSA
ncbi:fructosamine kinase family protein [uncultured Algibacter sp.]|uniref:fructosamine kinase family protein n=1 Tax=uncultured Algibacter sp. TaxID=298659 RepID=UPI0026358FB6|nr:fructosamine kinase family protein [uncultured Algibacter sp.]